jgi:Predicted transcriptional regulator
MGFSEQLKKARLFIGYTQQEVANLMGISKSTYCGYETGKRQPDVEKIKKLSKILDTSGDALLETGFEKKEIHFNFSLSEIEEQLISMYGESTLDALNLYSQLDSGDQGEIRGEMKQMLKAKKYSIKKELRNA